MTTNDDDKKKAFFEKIKKYTELGYNPVINTDKDDEKKWLLEYHDIEEDLNAIETMKNYVLENKYSRVTYSYYFYEEFYEKLKNYITAFEKYDKNHTSHGKFTFEEPELNDDNEPVFKFTFYYIQNGQLYPETGPSKISYKDFTISTKKEDIETNRAVLKRNLKAFINGVNKDISVDVKNKWNEDYFQSDTVLFQDDKLRQMNDDIKIRDYIDVYNNRFSNTVNNFVTPVRKLLGKTDDIKNLNNQQLKEKIITHYKKVLDNIKLTIDEFNEKKKKIEKYDKIIERKELTEEDFLKEIAKKEEEEKEKTTENYQNFETLKKNKSDYCKKNGTTWIASGEMGGEVKYTFMYKGQEYNCDDYDKEIDYVDVVKKKDFEIKTQLEKNLEYDAKDPTNRYMPLSPGGGKKTKRNKKSKNHKSLRKKSIRNKTRRQKHYTIRKGK
jgi:hypothetical protein